MATLSASCSLKKEGGNDDLNAPEYVHARATVQAHTCTDLDAEKHQQNIVRSFTSVVLIPLRLGDVLSNNYWWPLFVPCDCAE